MLTESAAEGGRAWRKSRCDKLAQPFPKELNIKYSIDCAPLKHVAPKPLGARRKLARTSEACGRF
jgi:hypothetical protein